MPAVRRLHVAIEDLLSLARVGSQKLPQANGKILELIANKRFPRNNVANSKMRRYIPGLGVRPQMASTYFHPEAGYIHGRLLSPNGEDLRGLTHEEVMFGFTGKRALPEVSLQDNKDLVRIASFGDSHAFETSGSRSNLEETIRSMLQSGDLKYTSNIMVSHRGSELSEMTSVQDFLFPQTKKELYMQSRFGSGRYFDPERSSVSGPQRVTIKREVLPETITPKVDTRSLKEAYNPGQIYSFGKYNDLQKGYKVSIEVDDMDRFNLLRKALKDNNVDIMDSAVKNYNSIQHQRFQDRIG